jgi:hypothetical protein
MQVRLLLVLIRLVLWFGTAEQDSEVGGVEGWAMGRPGNQLCCSCRGAAELAELRRRPQPVGQE